MRVKRFRFLALGLPLLMSCTAYAADPYAPTAMPYLSVSADGRYLGATTTRGDLKVWSLQSQKMIFEPGRGYLEGITFGQGITFVDFLVAEKKAIWNCAAGRVCWKSLEGEGHGTLFEHDPQDDILHGIVSVDAKRMVFGTVRGRIFTYDPAMQKQRELKPRDIWSRGHSWQIYTLEGTLDLQQFVSASASVYPLLEGVDFGTEWWKYENPGKGHAKYIKYNGIVVWDYETGEAHEIYDDFSDKIRADFSRDGSRLVIRQSGGRARGYRLPEYEQAGEYRFTVGPGTGHRFLGSGGEYFGMVGYQNRYMDLFRFDNEMPVAKLKLKNKIAGGRRMMVSYPEKGWVFVGLAKGGVDWYEFLAEPSPSLEHIATLK